MPSPQNRAKYNTIFLKKGGDMSKLTAYRQREDSFHGVRMTLDISQFDGLAEALKQVPRTVQMRVLGKMLKKTARPLLQRIKASIPAHDPSKYQSSGGMAVVTRNGKKVYSFHSGNLRQSYTMGTVWTGNSIVLWIGPNLHTQQAFNEEKEVTTAFGYYAAFLLFGSARFGRGYIVPPNNYLRFAANPSILEYYKDLAADDVVKYFNRLITEGISYTKNKQKHNVKIA